MSDLVGNPEDRFSRVAAQICLTWKIVKAFSWVNRVTGNTSLSFSSSAWFEMNGADTLNVHITQS